MNIFEKIEQIKQKPEHVRVRYVWLSVAISMIFIIIIWVLSLESGIKPIETNSEAASDFQERIRNIKNVAPSINELFNTAQDAKDSLNNQNQVINDLNNGNINGENLNPSPVPTN